MSTIFELNKKKTFTLQEAKDLLPLLHRITDQAYREVEDLKKKIQDVDPEPENLPVYEQQLSKIVEKWFDKITKLGCEPKGLWLVDFDNGEGYYCWNYPEDDVTHAHSYESGFQGRTLIL